MLSTSAEVDNTLRELQNSSYPTQPFSRFGEQQLVMVIDA